MHQDLFKESSMRLWMTILDHALSCTILMIVMHSKTLHFTWLHDSVNQIILGR